MLTCKCKTCGIDRPLDMYRVHRTGWRTSICKKCATERLLEQRRLLRAKPKIVPTEKVCSRCGETKKASEYYPCPHNANGLRSSCISCHINNVPAIKKKKLSDMELKLSDMVMRARARAKEADIPFDLDVAYMNEKFGNLTHCPAIGVPLAWGHWRRIKKGYRPDAPTIDKIIPSKGYVKGNVQVISQRANMMKNDSSLEELSRFADWARSFIDNYQGKY